MPADNKDARVLALLDVIRQAHALLLVRGVFGVPRVMERVEQEWLRAKTDQYSLPNTDKTKTNKKG